MRVRTWFLAGMVLSCGAFSASNDEPTTDGGADGGGGNDGGGGTDGPSVLDGGLDVSLGPAADAACDASRVCIDFETAGQRIPKFGFGSIDEQVEGGLVIHDRGFASSYGMALTARDDSYTRGQINLPDVPKALRIRMKVRSDARDSGASSDHFLKLECKNGGEGLSVKFSLAGEFAIQAGERGQAIGTYADGSWIFFDAMATYGTGLRRLALTRFDTNAANEITSDDTCEAPLSIRVQSSLTGGGEMGLFTLSVDDIAIDWN